MSTDDGSGMFGCRPILCVESVTRSLEHYVNVLKFRQGWTWSDEKQRFLQPGEPGESTFALVGLGRVQIMLSQQSQGSPGTWLHLDVETAEQLDNLHATWLQTGARIIEPPSIRAWGMYEMRLQDLDGHVFRVSAPPRNAETDAAGNWPRD